MNQFQNAFISYGRADSKTFAKNLNDRLVAEGLEVWFDFDDIPLGVDYQNQIDNGIECADNFLFIIAPHSVNSPYCAKEVQWALLYNKRIIPILHVEQITQEIWQQRRPQGTDAEWAEYQTKGLHSSFPNMHPELAKINWIYCREGIDDFEKAFQGLLEILNRQQSYVRQHTLLLAKALEWERQQKQSRYLLVGEERQQAEAWLKTRFKDEQAPCIPSPLHCEFITESIKNAHNLMTQIFLSYAEEEIEMMEKVRQSLRREGFTVWTNKTDIQTGVSFVEAIYRGIEEADNLVYLLSPAALQSAYCKQEIEYALSLNKRIIPILVKPTDLEQVPPVLQDLQYIDLTDNTIERDYQQDESQLVRVLHQDAAYYEEHKILLTKALKWERQNRNPSILLRGYNLQHAEAWLKLGKARSLHPPLPLQAEFIAASLQQPPDISLEVFVSYSRTDSDFARKLNDALQTQGKTTWFDQESIASGSDFQQEIYRGIENAENFLFILSPRSINSPYCADEVEYAVKLNKRMITILHQTVNTAELHPELAKVQWIDFTRQKGDFYTHFNELSRTLDTDREHVHNHTKWLQRAIEWEKREKDTDLLLRGSEFAIAENWLQEATQTKKHPSATALQTTFIQCSRDAIQAAVKQEKRRLVILRSLLGMMTAIAGVAVVASISAFKNQQEAHKSQQEATRGEIKALAESSKAQFALGKEFDALLSGLRAAKKLEDQEISEEDSSLQTQVLAALQQSVFSIREKNRLKNFNGPVSNVIFSPNGQMLATTDAEGNKLWRLDGTQITKLNDLTEDGFSVMGFSHNNQTIATFTQIWNRKNAIQIWGVDGKLKSQIRGKEGFQSVQFSPDHRTIATFDGDVSQLWQIDGKAIATLGNSSVVFSEDGQTIAGVDADQQVMNFWQRDGKLISTVETEKEFTPWALNQGGSLIVMSDGKTLKLQNREGHVLNPLVKSTVPGNMYLAAVMFSPDGKTIAAVYNNVKSGKGLVKLWRFDGSLRATLMYEQAISGLEFTPDSQRVVVASYDKTVKLWNLDGTLLANLVGHGDWVTAIDLSPDGKTIVSASYDSTLKVWANNDSLLKKWDANQTVFSNDKQVFATAIENGPVAMWKMDGTPITTLIQKSEGLADLQFSQNGKTIVTSFTDSDAYGPVQLWNEDGKLVKTLIEKTQKPEGQNSVYLSMLVSQDGKSIVTNLQGSDAYGPLQLWNGDGKLVKTLIEKTQKPKGQNSTFLNVWVSQNGKSIVTNLQGSDAYGPLQLWNGDGKLVKTLIEKTQKPKGQNSVVLNVQLSEDGQSIVTSPRSSASYGPVKLWDAKQGTLRATLAVATQINQNKTPSIEFSEDSQTLLTVINSADASSVVKLWRSNGTLIKTLVDASEIKGSVTATFSQSDSDRAIGKTLIPNRIITAVPGGAVQLWDTDGTPLHTVTEKLEVEQQTEDLRLSPDGQILAVGLNRKKIQLWDVKGQKLLQTISHEGDAFAWSFSPDSQMFASGSFDNTIKLWSRSTKSVIPLNGHISGVNQLHFAPNGKNLTSISEKGNVILFPLEGLADLQTWVKRGCQHLGNYLQINANEEDRYLCDTALTTAQNPH
jgi:WD40 repeat protein